MGILNKLGTFISNLEKPVSYKDGESWEKDIEQIFFPPKQYALLHKTHDYYANNKRYVESSLLPDFKFRDLITKTEFYVECKFRSSLLEGKLQWSKDDQFKRYKAIKEPLFIAIAFQQETEKYYLIPLSKIKYPALFPSILRPFEVPFKKVDSKKLWSL